MQDLRSRISELLLQSAVPDSSKGNYDLHYRAIEIWFRDVTNWTWESVIQGSLMVYGWMPTILEGRKNSANVLTRSQAIEIANDLNAERCGEISRRFVNNSLVGTSKFLHFWRPQTFAIWDSHVCRALTGATNAVSDTSTVERYFAAIRSVAAEREVAIRKIEQHLFWIGRNAR